MKYFSVAVFIEICKMLNTILGEHQNSYKNL